MASRACTDVSTRGPEFQKQQKGINKAKLNTIHVCTYYIYICIYYVSVYLCAVNIYIYICDIDVRIYHNSIYDMIYASNHVQAYFESVPLTMPLGSQNYPVKRDHKKLQLKLPSMSQVSGKVGLLI